MKEVLKKFRIFMLSKYKFRGWKFIGNFYCGFNGINDVRKAKIGHRVYIGNKYHLAVDYLEIGNHTLLASNVSIVGGDHRFDEAGVPIRDSHVDFREGVIIGNDCWIGHGVIILSGVKIGDGAIIGAGSIVTKDVLPYVIVAGNPAKFIRNRFTKSQIKEHIIELKKYEKTRS